MLLIDGVSYKLWEPKDEEREFHPMIKEHSKEIFGEDSVYFDVKQKLSSRSGIGSIPDAYVIDLSRPYRWYIVENELCFHQVYAHVVNQVSRFIDGIEHPESQQEVTDVLYRRIMKDDVLKALIESRIKPQEIHRFLYSLIAKPPRVAIIIDRVTSEMEGARGVLGKLGKTVIVEFRTFVREDAENVHAHLFKPISAIIGIEKRKRERRRDIPEHYQNWDTMLAWVDEETRVITNTLTTRILRELKGVNTHKSGRNLCFYKGMRGTGSIFAAFILTKKRLKIRIGVDSQTFKDPKGFLKDKAYSGWFFKRREEREFIVSDKSQLNNVMRLVRQSYSLAEK